MPRRLTIEPGKRYTLGARTTLATYEAIKAAAVKSGRSVSHEIEHRLEMSFFEERLRAKILDEAQR